MTNTKTRLKLALNKGQDSYRKTDMRVLYFTTRPLDSRQNREICQVLQVCSFQHENISFQHKENIFVDLYVIPKRETII